MTKTRIITMIALLGMTSFASCKKDYTCTCTTVVGGVSADIKHDIDNSNYADAKQSCNNFEDQANKSLPGGTSCRL
ncbi:MAG: hypothetical protein K9G49_01795 [Taibaiella sp.]|nr:hypothetical protein [Taibaiella sp.]